MSATVELAETVVATALSGRSLAAADTLLVSETWAANLAETTQAVAGRAAAVFAEERSDGERRGSLVRLLLRLGMNLAGQEADTLGLPPAAVAASLAHVSAALRSAERTDAAAVGGEIDAVLADMRSVNAGDSLTALMAEDIAAALAAAPTDGRGATFLSAFAAFVARCVYTAMTRQKLAKFGNDFARGLEYLRHLGFVQVSTNPVLAAKAFDEDPVLVDRFRAAVRARPEWLADPAAHGDAMALRATLIALWPNLEVFRPLALRCANADYMVSFQLNPNIADRAEESLVDARAAFAHAADYLAEYDGALGVATPGSVPPCIVFKVAGSHAACRQITRELNSAGIGTNNTVVYSVGQEVQLILDAMAGKAAAVKAGRAVTRTYETNMGGRFSSHLREVEAEKIVAAAEVAVGREQTATLLAALADAVKVAPTEKNSLGMKSLSDQARLVCAFRYLKNLEQPAFVPIGLAAGRSAEEIATLEADIRKAGTLVARRVYGIFFGSDATRARWREWLSRTYGLSESQARLVHESMDVLPASKRIVEDTLHALGYPNMCHTEFPNHSRAVELAARQPDFRLAGFANSLLSEYAPEVAARLSSNPDFVAGYELTGELSDLLVREVGLTEAGRFGRGGLSDRDWPRFGPVVKTGAEFRAAYDGFVARCVKLAREVAAPPTA